MSNNISKTLTKIGLLAVALLCGAASVFAQPYFNVKDYGATGKKTDNAQAAIQKAIDACSQAGGGTVFFPAGDYLTTTFFLKNNVNLYLSGGATLFASRVAADYKFTKGIYSTETDTPVLIYGDGVKNVSISGKGTIDGQAEHVVEPLAVVDNFIKDETENARASGVEMKRVNALEPKVSLVYIINSRNILLEDVSILHSPNWTIHLANDDEVVLRGLYVFSSLEKGVNSDGIDVDGCKNVRISDCNVVTGDDAICLKSTNKNGKYYSCENITVTNCTLVSTSTALKLGTESHGDFKNIIFSNSVITNTNRGISIVVRDGASVENVIFSNLTITCNRKPFFWWGDGDPIRFVLLKRKPESRLGSIKNVLVENVYAKGQGTSLIAGFEGKDLEGITLSNVKFEMEAEGLPDKRAIQALRVNGINGLTLKDVSVTWNEKNTEKKWGSAIYAKNISNLLIDNFSGKQAPGKTDATLLLEDIKQGCVRNSIAQPGTETFVQFVGKNTNKVRLMANELSEAKKKCVYGADVNKKNVMVSE